MLTTALVLPAAAASAQTGDYPGGPEGEVLGQNLQQGDPGGGGTQVRGVTVSRSAGLALTGTDAIQLTGIGVVLIAGGTVVVRRSRKRPATVTA